METPQDKQKAVILGIVAALQPFLWYLIYSLVDNDSFGLAFACLFSCILSTVLSGIYFFKNL